MKWITVLFILFSFITYAQKDTFPSAKAYQLNYLSVPMSGIDHNEDFYSVGLKLNYDENGAPLPMEVVRLNLTDGTTMARTMEGSVSSVSVIWRVIMDSFYQVHAGLNSGNRVTWIFDFQDSIRMWNIGGFATEELSYSMSLGRDKHIIHGGSSGPYSTLWAESYDYDFIEHPAIDETQSYVLSIQGDTNWVYPQVGQNLVVDYWAVRKSDNYKKKLATVSSETRFNIGTYKEGCFVQIGGLWYKVRDTTLTQQALPAGNPIDVHQVADGVTWFDESLPQVRVYLDEPNLKVHVKVNGDTSSIDVPASTQEADIRLVVPHPYDTTIVMYVGDYYGDCYWYDKDEDEFTVLGKMGMNVYAYKWVNDSTLLFSGYPSGVLIEYNLNHSWTANAFNPVTGLSYGLTTTTNPRVIVNFRSQTTGDFSHARKILLFGDVVASAGDVIRTNNTASFAFCNRLTGQKWAFSADSMDRKTYVDIAKWRDYLLFSTSDALGGTAKLYRYNVASHTMLDSLNFGWHSYGHMLVTGDKLIIIAQDTSNPAHTIDSIRLAKINLSTGLVTYNLKIRGTLNAVFMFADGVIGISKSGSATIPLEFWPTRTIENKVYEYGEHTDHFATYGKGVIEYQNLISQKLNMETAAGRAMWLKQVLDF